MATVTPRAGFLVPEVELAPSQAAAPPGGGGGGSGGNTQIPHPALTPDMYTVAGAALFAQDRLAGWMSPEEAGGANWLAGTVHHDTAEVDGPGGSRVSLMVLSARVRRRAVREGGGQPAVVLSVETEEAIRAVEGGPLRLDHPAAVADLDARAAADIRQRMAAALSAARSQGVDAFGFGTLLAEYEPGAWRILYPSWPQAL